jgi:hypothetical protein
MYSLSRSITSENEEKASPIVSSALKNLQEAITIDVVDHIAEGFHTLLHQLMDEKPTSILIT